MAAQLSGDVTSEVLPAILHTKIHAPVTRRLVPRDQLFETLKTHPGVKLTLICAPAGCGKSSLLAGWAAVDDLDLQHVIVTPSYS